MSKSSTLKLVVVLAVIQGLAGLARGFNWVQFGGDLFQQGLLLLPMVGAVAVIRGLFIAGVALMYLLFVVGALLQKSWAWWMGLIAAGINLIVVVSALSTGGLLAEGIAWSVIPVILLWYLFSKVGTQELRRAGQP